MDTSERGPADRACQVRQVAVPAEARALSTLSRVDYADAFVVDTDLGQDRTAEQWPRLILQGAPVRIRTRLLVGWSMIGLKLGRGGFDRSVLGWELRANTADFVLLGADSRIGMPGELLFKPTPGALLFCTFVQQDNCIARAVWTAIEPVHVRVVRDVLEHAGRRLRSTLLARGES
ncbi:MAG: hypothetical protein JOZ49_18300 [Mycolicibacterium sp.]|nr:hypothetical protein [Mycolicibacterium sp.]